MIAPANGEILTYLLKPVYGGYNCGHLCRCPDNSETRDVETDLIRLTKGMTDDNKKTIAFV